MAEAGRAALARFLQLGPAVRLRLIQVKGSAPRGRGTEMFVREDRIFGTIGGGRLEQISIEGARRLLREGGGADLLAVPLGPEIGQCCGGHVSVAAQVMGDGEKAEALRAEAAREAARPHLYILGAGHMGRAMADQAAALPLRSLLVDSRAEELALSQAPVEQRLTALPEQEIVDAPPNSAFVILTHDHGLDFLLTSEALKRGDAAYVGLIGSATKRAKFLAWCRESCAGLDPAPLTCPIGAAGLGDKRPAIIAAFTLAEILAALAGHPAQAPLATQ